jgi:glycosyltransferase involved in cell wall biosynthesis
MSSTASNPPSPAADIVIPVYNEGANIIGVLESLRTALQFPVRILICYDRDEDDTLTALQGYRAEPLEIKLVKNRGRGALGAVMTGFEDSTAPCTIVFPADDDYNAARVNNLIIKFQEGHDIVAASRFMQGGTMENCPWFKALLVRSSALFMWHVARAPTRDSSNGLRLFSRRVLEQIPIESKVGFAYSIELLVKTARLRWPVTETPFLWTERKAGQSRFRTLRWLPQYLRWVFYALRTTYLRRGPGTVQLRPLRTNPTP